MYFGLPAIAVWKARHNLKAPEAIPGEQPASHSSSSDSSCCSGWPWPRTCLGTGSTLCSLWGFAGLRIIAAILWVLYVAVETHIRRHWPDTLISWVRLIIHERDLFGVSVEEEGTDSTFRALLEVFERHRLALSLYTDRGSHYFHTVEAGGKVDRGQPTQVGRALAHLGVEHIAAYSPQARGRSERLFQTLQDRVPKELALAGITTVAEERVAARYLYTGAQRTVCDKAEQEGSAFVAVPGLDLAEVLCVQEDRVVGNDNCVSFLNRKLQIPESPLRPHFVKATVKVHQYPNCSLAFSMAAVVSAATTAKAFQSANHAWKATREEVVPSRRQARAVLRAVKDASRRDAVTSPSARPSLTAPPRVARSHARSAPGNGPDSPTRKCPTETPLLRRTKHERAAT